MPAQEREDTARGKDAGCLCGRFRAVVAGEPTYPVAVCPCLACQRRSGSAFACNAFFPIAHVRLEGPYRVHIREGQDGRRIRRHCRPDCGTTVVSQGEKFPGMCNIPVGAFADPRFPAPVVPIFEESKHAWVAVPKVDHVVQGRAPGAVRPTGS